VAVAERTQSSPPAVSPVRRLALIALMCLVLGGIGGVLAATATRTERPVAQRFVPLREPAYDFVLRDQDGRPARLADARGKVVALTFIYANCRDLCPAEGNDVAAAMDEVGGGVEAYIVSVDPVGDTPQRARDWIRRRGLTGKARYLLGTRDQLRPVWIHYGIAPIDATREEALAAAAAGDAFRAANPNPPAKPWPYVPPPEPTEPAPGVDDAHPEAADLAYRGRARHVQGWAFEHSAYVLLIDKRGEQRLGIPFESLDSRTLARDMRVLLAEP